MPTRDRRLLLDTSVAVALAVGDHVAHAAAIDAVGGFHLGLSGHAYFETFSVLTRIPPPSRRDAREVEKLLSQNFPGTVFLGIPGAEALGQRFAELVISGGSVYDALVAAAAGEHGVKLLSRDSRAADTYRLMGIDFDLMA